MIERRIFTGEVRASGDKGNIIEGYGAMYDVRSVDMGFTEVIEQGAFNTADISDVRMLNDHLSHMILARTKSGTLNVSLDDKGLFYRADIADTSFGRDLLVSVGRGDVDQSSFGFSVEKDDWEYTDGVLLRHILKIASVVDVSPTAFPAYPDTHIDKRNQFDEKKLNEIRSILSQPHRGIEYLDAMVKVHRIIYS